MIALPEKTLDRAPKFDFAAGRFSAVRRSNHGGLAWQARNDRFPITANFKLGALPQQRLLHGAPSRCTALSEQDPQISFQFGLLEPQAPSCLRRQPVGAAGGKWLALRRGRSICSRRTMLLHPGCGSWVTDEHQVRDGAQICRHGPREAGFGIGPWLVSPTKPHGISSRDSRSGIRLETTRPPNLTPKTCCPPHDPRPCSSSQRGLPRHLPLERVHSGRTWPTKKAIKK